LMFLTGIIMWFPLIFPRSLVQVLYPLHALGVIAIGGFVMVHIYLGTYGNPGTFRSITYGKVTRAWVKKHHGKWLKELEKE